MAGRAISMTIIVLVNLGKHYNFPFYYFHPSEKKRNLEFSFKYYFVHRIVVNQVSVVTYITESRKVISSYYKFYFVSRQSFASIENIKTSIQIWQSMGKERSCGVTNATLTWGTGIRRNATILTRHPISI